MIHPLPERFRNDTSHPHVIVRKPVHNMNKNVQREIINTEKQNVIDLHNYKHRKKRRKKVYVDELRIKPSEENTKERNSSFNKVRIKRTKRNARESFPAGSPVFVETAVFVDRDLFDHMTTNFPHDTERELIRFVLAMINAVSIRVLYKIK